MSEYDFLIVGSGLYGAICAYELNKKGYKCLVVEKRSHIGGNIYTEEVDMLMEGKTYAEVIAYMDEQDESKSANRFKKFEG